MAGSLGLNKRFTQTVKNIVGEDEFYHLRKTKGFEEAMNQFDKNIKTAFRGDPDEDYYVNFPMAKLLDDPANSLVANCWNMKGDDVKKIFQPLITDIERMVQDQLNLVLVKRLSEGHPKTNEIRGAVLSQLPQEAAITSTVATKHLGVAANAPYDEREDRGQPTTTNKYTGKQKVSKMTWYIHRGEDMQRDQKIVFSFYRSLPASYTPSMLIFTNNLLESPLDQAPPDPRTGSTTTNCKLTADLTGVSKQHFEPKVGLVDGTPYVDISYDLVVSMKTAIMKFSLEVEGVEMGSVEASYD
ncbi:MAG: hypothetical protein LQ350_002917 [Teloschistes chrysophthalmus]|nr:MAG: hypothetical protein LQ350_002917 [Niorma chrysophthalma]